MSLNDSLFGEESLRWRDYEKVLLAKETKPVQHNTEQNIIKLLNKQGDIMASGEFAKPIYKLITDLGDSEEARQLVLDNLIKYLSGEEIERFVESFRRDYDIQDEMETNDYVMCMSCQVTHHEDEGHTCDDQDTQFFSLKIPSC